MKLSLEDISKVTETSIPFIKNTGIKAVLLEPGHVRLEMPIKGNENHVGMMYAGALFTLAEVPGGAIFMTSFDVEKYYPIVKDFYIKFKKPALTSISVVVRLDEKEIKRIEKEVDSKGKADFILESELKSTKGEVVAVAKGTYQLRKYGS